MALQPGSLVGGRYRIASILARGGMGAVYDAVDERLSRPVALKVLLPELASDADLVVRFEREAIAAARLSHPGIVQVHDFGTTDGGMCYLVMERVSGRTLAQVLASEGRLPAERAVDVAEQALGALASAHAAGIVHRDLKPGNVMLVPIGGDRVLVKLLDFGIAQLKEGAAYTRLTRTGEILGTPAFLSPEQARGEPSDARTDVYAIGVLLYCLLTGRRPLEGRDAAETLRKVVLDVPPRADAIAPDVPSALAAIVDAAMRKRPDERFATAAAFAAALASWRARGAREGGAIGSETRIDPQTGPLRSAAPPPTTPPLGALQLPSWPPGAAPAPASASAPAPAPASASAPAPASASARAPASAPRLRPRVVVMAIALLALLCTFLAAAAALALVFVSPLFSGSAPPAIASAPSRAPISACEAAARCCERLAAHGQPAMSSGCGQLRALDGYGAAVHDSCRSTLRSYRGALANLGGDPRDCDFVIAPEPLPTAARTGRCAQALACCRSFYAARGTGAYVDCDDLVQRADAVCATQIASWRDEDAREGRPVTPECW